MIIKSKIFDVRVSVTSTMTDDNGKVVRVGNVRAKIHLGKDEIIKINPGLKGVKVADEAGNARDLVGEKSTVTLVVPTFEWSAWRSEMLDSFPKIFGTVELDIDNIEHIRSKDGKKDWLEISGFTPVSATGKTPLPDVCGLPAMETRKKDATGPATPPSNF